MNPAAAEPLPSADVTVERLTVLLPDGRCLLRDAHLTVLPGELLLIVGPSGSGKSTLLRMIAGLYPAGSGDLQISGSVRVAGAPPGRPGAPRVGIVFQNLALFDELTAVENVRFALDHGPGAKRAAPGEAEQSLRALGVPLRTHLSRLSGGERQRVAVARTLAVDPPLLLFDEPTTGLDPLRAHAMADLIAETHRRLNKTIIVVTHDFAPFLQHAPRLVLVDPASGRLREVDEPQLRAYFARPQPASPRVADLALPVTALRRLRGWIEAPGDALLTLLVVGAAVAGGWRRPRWKARYLWHYLRMVALGTTAIYVLLAGAMLGFVFTSFSFSQLPYSKVTVPLLTEEFLAATGYSTYRVVVPLLIAVLMAGKCGAAVAADVGARRLTNQFEALESLGVRPRHYFYGNIAVALLFAGPLLTLLAYAANWYAALIAYLITSEDTSVGVFRRNFFATLWPATRALPKGTGWVVLKAATSGLLIAALSYAIGSRPKESSVDVSRDVRLTIFWATLAVLALHSVYSFVEF